MTAWERCRCSVVINEQARSADGIQLRGYRSLSAKSEGVHIDGHRRAENCNEAAESCSRVAVNPMLSGCDKIQWIRAVD